MKNEFDDRTGETSVYDTDGNLVVKLPPPHWWTSGSEYAADMLDMD